MDKLEEFIKGNIKADFTRQSDQFYLSVKESSITIKPLDDKKSYALTISNDKSSTTYFFLNLEKLAERANEIISYWKLKDTQTKLF